MPLYASIDIGSNTLRLLVAQRDGDRIADVFVDRRITRLGKRVHRTGRLQEEQKQASVAVLGEFGAIIKAHGVAHVRAVATSALRRASNAESFIQQVLSETGIVVDVISGDEEAELTMRGILSSMPASSSDESLFALDIGGGSTEWILSRENRELLKGSIPIGVIQLAEDTIFSDPISDADIFRMHKAIILALETIRTNIQGKTDRKTLLIGTAGTFTTIATLDLALASYERERVHLHTVPRERLLEMERKLLPLPLSKRKNLPGMDPGRADLIIPGLHFTINCMELLHFDRLVVSDYGLLEGTLLSISEEDEKNI